MKQCGELTQKK